MKCQKCGFQNQEGAKFCKRCGGSLEKQKSSTRIWIVSAILIVVCVSAAVFLHEKGNNGGSGLRGFLLCRRGYL
ncbi:zinc ribbon domain-containing protein [uncultured Dubosiella sp.]|uniref:double zinc ribbon domain-containing protein n=1 Tax=uncultured Dubosiella sp. TaxID=1937011 RepID=UPI00339D9F09